MHVHHVGIATDQLDALVERFGTLLDVSMVHEEELDHLRLCFLDTGTGLLELLEPTDSEGPIAYYLDNHGPGIHHLAFETEDIPAALERARNLGITTIDDEPRPGAWGHEIAFLHPSDTGGVLIEFVAT